MKKFLALIMALLMMLSLAACGDNAKDAGADNEEAVEEEKSEKDDENKNADGEDEKGENEEETTTAENKEEEKVTEAEKEEETKKENLPLSFSATTIIDNADVTINVKDVVEDDVWGLTLKTEIVNKSSDVNYMVSVSEATVNNVVIDPSFATEVAAGKTANADISFSDDIIEKNVGNFTDIALTIRVYDSDNYGTGDIVNETVHIYPYGQENAKTYVREAKATDTVLFDNEYATFIVTDYNPDDFWGYAVNVYIVNKTDSDLGIRMSDVSVNDMMVDPYFTAIIPAGVSSFESVTWYESDFEDNGITDVTKIEFTLSATNYDVYGADDYVNETFVLNP